VEYLLAGVAQAEKVLLSKLLSSVLMKKLVDL
jgi:hypothetical protein